MTASANKPLELKKRILSQKQQKKHNFSLGEFGEKKALSFLIKNNYQIIATNVRLRNKEVDIVAIDKTAEELVFIEVKTRSKNLFGEPSKAVNRKKIKSMQVVAEIYIQEKKLDLDYRFDIVTIISGKIHHYQNITW